MRPPIELLANGLPVGDLHWDLMANPGVWNQHTARTAPSDSPHHGLDDIWVRFADTEDVNSTRVQHDSVWYPCADIIRVKPLVMQVFHMTGATKLGGVLITRIPAGKTCQPHVDGGWHAHEYEKFGVQIASAPGQQFCFDAAALETKPGDLFWFRNDITHWVTNPTPYERITLICCVKES